MKKITIEQLQQSVLSFEEALALTDLQSREALYYAFSVYPPPSFKKGRIRLFERESFIAWWEQYKAGRYKRG